MLLGGQIRWRLESVHWIYVVTDLGKSRSNEDMGMEWDEGWVGGKQGHHVAQLQKHRSDYTPGGTMYTDYSLMVSIGPCYAETLERNGAPEQSDWRARPLRSSSLSSNTGSTTY